MMRPETTESAPATHGVVIRWARFYDAAVQIISLGREKELRDQTLALADIRPGEHVLDVGCGTGTLAIAVSRSQPEARVFGIDPAPTMVRRARQKAEAAGANVTFDLGIVEKLDVEDGKLDIVLSSLMLHHLPGAVLRAGLKEIYRVLRPGGRFVAVDFFGSGPMLHRLAGMFRGHRSHSEAPEGELVALLKETGFVEIRREPLRPSYLAAVVAHKPG